jgi:hypothetical protein
MIKLIKLELRKAFSSIGFKLAIIINLLLSICQVIDNAIGTYELNQSNAGGQAHRGFYGIDLFNRWIGTDCMMVFSSIFFLLLPLTAVLPYGCSYFTEKRKGYYLHIIHRSKKENYLISKYIAAFISGGSVIMIPMWINIMLNAMIDPAGMMNVNTWLTIMQPYFLSELYYTHPIVYVGAVLIMDFIWGGVCAGFALMFSLCIKNVILVWIGPMIFFQMWNLIESFIQNLVGRFPYELSPMRLFRAMTNNPNPAELVFIIQCMLLMISFSAFVFGGKKGANL